MGTHWTDPTVMANLIVAAVAIWYTIETQKLRRTAIKQLELTRQSNSAEILPYVLVGLHRLSLSPHLDQTKIKIQLAEWAFRRIELPGFGSQNLRLDASKDEILEVASTTDQVASHVLCILYDHRSRSFRLSPPCEVVAPRESGYFPLAEHPVTVNELAELFKKLYEDRGNYLIPKISALCAGYISYLIPVFFDLAGRLYAAPRPIYWSNDGTVLYGKSDLIQPEGYSEVFAPSFTSTEDAFGTGAQSKAHTSKSPNTGDSKSG